MLLRKILGVRFTFQGSQADLELLRSIHDGTYANTKPGNPNFHAYAAAVNTASELVVPQRIGSALIQIEALPANSPPRPWTSRS